MPNCVVIIITTGNRGGGLLAYHAGGRYTNSLRCAKCEASSGIVTETMVPCRGLSPCLRIAATDASSVWPDSGWPVSWSHPVCTVGTYPVHRSTANAAHSTHSGTANTDTVRRHHRLSRQPKTRTAPAIALSVIQIHSVGGAGWPATPDQSRYQCIPAATATPSSSATGTQSNRHRAERQPIATNRTAAAITWIVIGTQPCSNEMGWSASGMRSTVPFPGNTFLTTGRAAAGPYPRMATCARAVTSRWGARLRLGRRQTTPRAPPPNGRNVRLRRPGPAGGSLAWQLRPNACSNVALGTACITPVPARLKNASAGRIRAGRVCGTVRVRRLFGRRGGRRRTAVVGGLV